MKLALISGAVIAALIPLAAWQTPNSNFAAPEPACPNSVTHEPLVVFDVTGGTASPLDVTLTVFNDGWAKLATVAGGSRTSYRIVQLPGNVVAKLQEQLLGADALTLCDDTRKKPDTVLHTLTFLSNEQNPRGHTVSYWIGDGAYSRIDATLGTFIDQNFPALASADGSAPADVIQGR